MNYAKCCTCGDLNCIASNTGTDKDFYVAVPADTLKSISRNDNDSF